MCVIALTAACGGKEDVALDSDGGGGAGGGDGGSAIDGGGGTPDAVVGGTCGADKPQCNNCLDDDDDGLADGFDPECTGVLDDDEGSFSTGIPGDNMDQGKQDCFFDGNSGGSCQVDVCCLYADGACPIDDPPNDCAFDLECIAECVDLVPPGCDCFGCCTICNDVDCFDIQLGFDGCTEEGLGTDACPTCQKFETCTGGDCNANPDDCILCPGEDAGDLPVGCGGNNDCPNGQTSCTIGGAACADNQYCQSGCCVSAVP